ncbi:MAG: prolyl oligopeptidase family serine peptidase, partial [Acidobacteria bacterium]|nr:prolyl oligopeptidase family serine peptidase [Acidobacteriota bacterium]
MHLRTFAAVMTALLITAAAVGAPIEYPKTKKVEQVDDYHGTKVADPYRWLETDVRTSKDVADWVAAENKITFDYLGTIPEREPIRKQLTTLWNYEKYSTPYKRGGHYFFSKNNGLQNQFVVYTVDKWGDTPRVLLDPNGWSKDGTVALGGVSVSDDAKYVAYAAAEAGSDWQTIRVVEVANGNQLSDELKWVKFSGISWTKDDKGFFYSRFPAVESGKAYQSLNRDQKVYYHRLGTPQSDDPVVYYDPSQPEWNHGADVSEDGRYLIISTTQGTANRNQVHVRDLQDPYAMPVTVVDKIENDYTFVGNDGPVLYFRTDLNAQKGRLIAIDLRNPARENWKEILPESDATLQGVDYTGHRFVANYLRDAHSEIRLFDTSGKPVRTVELDGIGSAGGFGGRSDDTETFYSFSSFATPPSVYRYDIATGEKQLVFRAKVAMNPADYEVKQVFYTSKDGTKVPMFISYKKGLKLDGNNPTLLYAYGGFDISLTPSFSISRLTWMNMGGVYAVANLRGGGEYGEAWHDAGTKLHKQNV